MNKLERIPEVVQVYADTPISVIVYFDDGRIKRFDASPLIAQGERFQRLQDESFFRTCCTVMNGTLAWDLSGTRDDRTCLDIDPLEIWMNSPDVEEPEPLRSQGLALDQYLRAQREFT